MDVNTAAKAAAEFCWAQSTPLRDSLWNGSDASSSTWGYSHKLGPDVDVETPDKLKLKSKTRPADAEEVTDSSAAKLRAEAAEFVPWAAPIPEAQHSRKPGNQTAVQATASTELTAIDSLKASFPSVPPPLPKSLTTILSHMTESDGSTLRLPSVDSCTLPLPSSVTPGAFDAVLERPLPEGEDASLPREPDDGAVAAAIDTIFEPFALQHNSHLLLAIARHLGKMTDGCAAVGTRCEGWPWTIQALARVAFTTEDLVECTSKLASTKHVAAALRSLANTPNPDLSILRQLLRVDSAWHLRSPPEIRCFLAAPDVPRSLVSATTRAILGRSAPPAEVVTVLSYAVTHLFEDQVKDSEERWQRLMQQLRACHTDILCLQGFQPQTQAGSALAMRLKADGFAYAAAALSQSAPCRQANAIFWDQRRWDPICEPQGHGYEGCAALLVELRLRADPAVAFRVASLQPKLVDCCNSALGAAFHAPPSTPSVPAWASLGTTRAAHSAGAGMASTQPPIVPKKQLPLLVCADLSAVGGAEAAILVPGLLGLRSAMLEATGEELASPKCGAPEKAKRTRQKLRLRPLCRYDTVLSKDLTRVLVLSGHTEGYLSTMPETDLYKQFPAGRLPIVAAFSLPK